MRNLALVLADIVIWTIRLAPAAALLSLGLVLEGDLRWLGLFGLIPLTLAFMPGCAACGAHRDATTPGAYRPWVGH